jgi:hypothetical protein
MNRPSRTTIRQHRSRQTPLRCPRQALRQTVCLWWHPHAVLPLLLAIASFCSRSVHSNIVTCHSEHVSRQVCRNSSLCRQQPDCLHYVHNCRSRHVLFHNCCACRCICACDLSDSAELSDRLSGDGQVKTVEGMHECSRRIGSIWQSHRQERMIKARHQILMAQLIECHCKRINV